MEKIKTKTTTDETPYRRLVFILYWCEFSPCDFLFFILAFEALELIFYVYDCLIDRLQIVDAR
ncbi:hypothetical protein OUZ56_032069 [Daphnia magna]|uniref:Uncharacterized protein n=1 Tax=Daphnia magna TaxID=35525 RepID=A0ABQ9ZW61_9CRUS|nr:hypothetical protein OUZ56_032069 [Daphnia magna]